MKEKLIIQRWDELFNERQASVDEVWQDVERYVLPLRGEFYIDHTSENQTDWDRGEVFDSTAVVACKSLASSMQANITSFATQWFDLKFKDTRLHKEDAAMEWLEAVAAAIYDALVESNFDVEIAESYLDLSGYGTSILFEEEEDDDLVFTALPLRDVVFEENSRKQASAVYRRLNWTVLQIIDKFGEENVPSCILEKKDAPDAGVTKKEIIFAVYPRDTDKDLDTNKPIAPKVRPLGYKYVLKSSAELLGEEGGYYEMPAYVTRWARTGGSKWGHSPAITCIADIRTLNEIKQATLEAAGKVIDPAMLVLDATVIGDINLERGGETVVTEMDGLRPFESGARFDISNMEIGMLMESIRKSFFQDQLELKDSPAMTATEVNVRYELMQRLLGPVVARLKSDLLDPVIQRTFNILLRRGDLPEMPEGLTGNIDIEYTGTLPRSQKAQTAMSMTTYMNEIAQLAEIFPQLLDIVDTDAMARELAILRGVPAKTLHSQDDIDAKREAQQQQQQQQEQIMMAQQGGEAMKSMGEGAQSLQGVEGMEEMMGGMQ